MITNTVLIIVFEQLHILTNSRTYSLVPAIAFGYAHSLVYIELECFYCLSFDL